MILYRVADPSEALIVSGWRAHRGAEGDAAGMGFKIIVGKGVWVWPGLQKVRRLSLDIHEAELNIACVTTQGISVDVKAVVIYKIGDDLQSIANAARRFLEQMDQMDVKVHNVFAGHLRSIIGSMTIEEMIRERDKLAQQTRESAAVEMERLGLVIDSLQIQEMSERSGYITNLGAPEAARVNKEARIAEAAAEREAAEKTAEAAALIAAAQSKSAIRQAEVQAEAETARSTAEQAGPLAAAQAKQQVVVQETEVAKLEALRREQQLEAEVRRPADANAYKTRTEAEADRDRSIAEAQADAKQVELSAEAEATKTRVLGQATATATELTGLADAKAIEAKGLAEANAIEARAQALATNAADVVNQQVAQMLPQLVEKAAAAFGGIDNLTVLTGPEGVTGTLNEIIGLGLGAMPLIRELFESGSTESGNGHRAFAQKSGVGVPGE